MEAWEVKLNNILYIRSNDDDEKVQEMIKYIDVRFKKPNNMIPQSNSDQFEFRLIFINYNIADSAIGWTYRRPY